MSPMQGIYLRPRTIDEALRALASGAISVLAGGTDFYAARAGQAVVEPILDISAVPELRGLRDEATQLRIGATTTWSDIVRADLPSQFRGLQAAAREVGGIQVQNAGTVAGNICNASPAADGIPVLMALDAQVELSSLAGQRTIPVTEFVLGSRKIVRRTDELVTAIVIPKRQHAASSFLKLGHRRYLVISIVMVAAAFESNEAGEIIFAGIAVGSCSAVAKRLRALEQKLLGRHVSESLSSVVTADDLGELTPMDDVRGTAVYRRDAALTLVKRAIEEVCHE